VSAADPGLTTRSRQERDTALQRIIDHLAVSGEGRPLQDLVTELEQQIARQGLPALPDKWVRAVASSAAEGNPYVVSSITAQRDEIPRPDTPNSPYSVT